MGKPGIVFQGLLYQGFAFEVHHQQTSRAPAKIIVSCLISFGGFCKFDELPTTSLRHKYFFGDTQQRGGPSLPADRVPGFAQRAL